MRGTNGRIDDVAVGKGAVSVAVRFRDGDVGGVREALSDNCYVLGSAVTVHGSCEPLQAFAPCISIVRADMQLVAINDERGEALLGACEGVVLDDVHVACHPSGRSFS